MLQSATDFDEAFETDRSNRLVRTICERHQLRASTIERPTKSEHAVFLVGEELVIKIFRPCRNCFDREHRALEFFHGKTLFTTSAILHVGRIEDLDYIVMTRIPGRALDRPSFLDLRRSDQIEIVTQLAEGMRQMHRLNVKGVEDDWAVFVGERARSFVERQIAHGVNDRVIRALPEFVDQHLAAVPMEPTTFLHGDVHLGNLRFESVGGRWGISGLFDFADSRRAFYEYDFLAVGVLILQGQGELQREFFRAYGYMDADLDMNMRRRLMMLTMLYETSDLRRYAMRLRPDAVELSLEELEKAIWSFVD